MTSSSPSRAFDAVLFDIDGTLVNTIPMIVAGLGDAFEHYSGVRPVDADILRLIGTPLTTQMNLFGLDRHNSTLDERVEFTMERYVAHAAKILPFPGAEAAYAAVVEAGVPTALVTSRNRAELDWILTVFPQFNASSVKVSSSDVKKPKPDAEPVLLACQLLEISPASACYVGDSVHDVESAHAAGATAVAVAYGASPLRDLQLLSPEILIERPDALRDWAHQTFSSKIPCYSTQKNELNPAPPAATPK